jgi:hypothetical protein
VLNDRLVMIWKGIDNNQDVWFTTYNGSSWAPPLPIPGIGTARSDAEADDYTTRNVRCVTPAPRSPEFSPARSARCLGGRIARRRHRVRAWCGRIVL